MAPITASSGVSGGRRLFVSPTPTHFKPAELARLTSELHTRNRATVLQPASEPADLQLDDQCRTRRGGYRYTAYGFRQLCGLVSPGLWRLVAGLSGSKAQDLPDEFINGRLAIRIFNELVDLRFAALSPYRLVRDTRGKTIDGLLGTGHQYLENVSFLDSIVEAMPNAAVTCQFQHAYLAGRRLSLWWRTPTPICSYQAAPLIGQVQGTLLQIYAGYYFCNGEATGTSARATLALFTRYGTCLGPYKLFGDRVHHRGRDFHQRLGVVLDGVLQRPLPIGEWQQQLTPVLNTSLEFTYPMEIKARKQRIRSLATNLRQFGVDYSLAREIVQIALQRGRRIGESVDAPTPLHEQLSATRTALDLLAAALYVARRLDMTRRERVEQAAFSIVFGKFF